VFVRHLPLPEGLVAKSITIYPVELIRTPSVLMSLGGLGCHGFQDTILQNIAVWWGALTGFGFVPRLISGFSRVGDDQSLHTRLRLGP